MSPLAFTSRRLVLGVVLVSSLLGLALGGASRAEEKKKPSPTDRIEFTWTLSPEDPFSNENMVGTTPKEFKRGETFFVTINGMLKPGFHTYPLTKRTPVQNPAGLPKLTYNTSEALVPLWPVQETEPEFFDEESEGIHLEHDVPFTWTQEFFVRPTAKPGQETLRIHIRLQVCDETCVWSDHDLTIPITISSAEAVPVSPTLLKRTEEKAPALEVVEVPAGMTPKNRHAKPQPTPGTTPETPAKKPPEGFAAILLDSLLFIGLAALAGLVSLFTPCVFPMIPITVSYFLKQSESKHTSPVKMAGIYSGTIVVVLTLGGLLLMTSLQRISQHWITNLILGLLFVVFALSLFGMYEITLPSFLTNLTASRQDQGGAIGTVFMALTFTIVSFTCVAPFYGGFAATIASAQSVWIYFKLFFAALAYSVMFALPFFILALFPGLMRMLPKSGGWMNTIKVVMGFLELAAAVGFLRGAELVWTRAQPQILTFDVVVGIWIALSLTCGLYLLGLFRLPHDYDAPQMLSVPRLLFALTFIALGLYLVPSLFKQPNGSAQRPNGVVFEWIESFLLADSAQPTSGGHLGGPNDSKELAWVWNLNEGLARAKKEKKRVFIDFTGVTCKNCRINENNVFTQPEVRDLMNQYVLVQLYTDTIPVTAKNSASAEENAKLEFDRFGDSQLPLYVIVEPDGESFKLLEKYPEGKINNVGAFKEFLKRHLPAK